MIFTTGNELVVITRGPGNLRLLSWQNNAGGTNTVGAIPTSNAGITRYLISFSHHYERFAFYWDGAGEAVYQIGNRLERRPVGRNWNSASTVNWGAAEVTNTNVAGIAEGAVNRDRVTTAFIIPDSV
ncbi:hypothetical protein AX16_010857 [Volvariella volvacea WC 439]|nr:hypothetical protein AX16_010857 [Volvariella volvacea WC 439]